MSSSQSPSAIRICEERFAGDTSKRFRLYQPERGLAEQGIEAGDLALSLDVVYHLVEDPVFEGYMTRLLEASTRFVIVYSNNTDTQPAQGHAVHVRNRKFTDWMDEHASPWRLLRHVPNEVDADPDTASSSHSSFFFYERSAGGGHVR